MSDELHEFALVLGGRTVEGVWDRVRRYCGLAWSGGPAETWAYRFYDVIDTDTQAVGPVDVVAAAALHSGLSRSDLAYFHDHSSDLAAWLKVIPTDVVLRDADDSLIYHLGGISAWEAAPSVSLLTKVLHRKRPGLVPLVDAHVLDWYRPVTGERSARRAWPGLLRALRTDLQGQNALRLAIMNIELEKHLGRPVSHLRLVDIALWMGGHTK